MSILLKYGSSALKTTLADADHFAELYVDEVVSAVQGIRLQYFILIISK